MKGPRPPMGGGPPPHPRHQGEGKCPVCESYAAGLMEAFAYLLASVEELRTSGEDNEAAAVVLEEFAKRMGERMGVVWEVKKFEEGKPGFEEAKKEIEEEGLRRMRGETEKVQ